MAAPLIALIIPTIIKAVIDKIVERPDVPQVTPDVGRTIKREILQELEQDPRFQHVTNTEPFYKSRVAVGSWAAILSSFGLLLQLYADGSLDFSTAMAPTLAIIGSLTALYGRYKATAPIGG